MFAMMPRRTAETSGPPLDQVDALRGRDPLTIPSFARQVCERYAGNEALVFDDPLRGGETVRWTYAELGRQSRRVGAALLAAGVGAGSRVAIWMANRPEAVAGLFGAALAGAVAMPLSTFATSHELAEILRAGEPDALLMQATMGSRHLATDVEQIADVLPRLVVGLGPGASGMQPWDEFLALATADGERAVEAAARGVGPDDHGLVMFSSGTTSVPKGVLHNHRAPTLQFWLQAELFGRSEDTRLWTALPLFWTAGMNAIAGTLAAGGCSVLQEGFDAGGALRLMQRERVTEPYTLPHQARALAEHPDWAATDLSSLRSVFGKSVFTRHPTVTGDPDWQMPVGWGMSETCSFISAHGCRSGRDAMRRSLGRLLPGMRLRVVDPSIGETVGVGEEGELVVQGPTVMDRYLGKSRDECVDADGWFHTGDRGYIDDDGELHWSGRMTELIKTGGANVSPAEIEVQLRAHPAVKLARVIAVPDPRLDQVAVLCIEGVAGARCDADDIRSFLRERISSYKVPKHVLFFAPGEIPLTAGGTKVVDDALRELVTARMETAGVR
jgi:acyl-CoA synthetase (AMP-forming)/AMP-acid ligase II